MTNPQTKGKPFLGPVCIQVQLARPFSVPLGEGGKREGSSLPDYNITCMYTCSDAPI